MFNPGPKRRIVLATNVAETSLTVPRIHYVVDPGLARVKRYSPRQKLDRLHIEPVVAGQRRPAQGPLRAHRAGHVLPPVCGGRFRIARALHRSGNPPRRAGGRDPAHAVAGPGAHRGLPVPGTARSARGRRRLAAAAANSARSRRQQRKLTPIGRTMARLPVDVKLARMLVAAQRARLPARDARDRRRSSASRIRANARPTSAPRPTTRMRNSPIRVRSSSASSSCGRRIAARTRTSTQSQAAQVVREALPRLPAHARMARTASAAEAAVRGTGLAATATESPTASSTPHYATLHRALIAGLPTQIGQRGRHAASTTARAGASSSCSPARRWRRNRRRGCCRRRCSTPSACGR